MSGSPHSRRPNQARPIHEICSAVRDLDANRAAGSTRESPVHHFTRACFKNRLTTNRLFPQGLKPGLEATRNGTAEAVPFQTAFLKHALAKLEQEPGNQ